MISAEPKCIMIENKPEIIVSWAGFEMFGVPEDDIPPDMTVDQFFLYAGLKKHRQEYIEERERYINDHGL